jgi:opacity protein-like surface antigen
MKLAMAVLAVLMLIPAAKADSSPPPLYVTFTDVFTGPSGETETFSGSFEYQPGEDGTIVPGTVLDFANGFLGNAVLQPIEIGTGYYNLSGSGIEIDLFMVPEGDTGLIGNFYLYGCYSTDCYGTLGPNGTNPGAYEYPESETFTVSAIPEPPMLAMMLAGLLSLTLIKRKPLFSR